jgi:DNA uptake protein ComE-like DNA-binding protein
MDNLFFILFLFSFFSLVVGLIKPTVFSRFIKGERTRRKVLKIFGIATISFFILLGVFADDSQSNKESQPVIESTQTTTEDTKENYPDSILEQNDISLIPEKEETPQIKIDSLIKIEDTTQVKTQNEQSQNTLTPQNQPEVPQNNCTMDQVNINSGSREELLSIIHIDNIRVDDLIRLRPYKSLDGLTRISGIGTVRMNDIKMQGIACVN